MSIVETTRGVESNSSGTTWLEKSPKYLVIIAPIILSLGLAGCGRSNAAIKLPDTEVLVARPVQQDVPIHNEWVATLDGYVNAEIRPQVSGYVIGQNYKEGAVVRKARFSSRLIRGPSRPLLTAQRENLPRRKRN